MNKEYFTALAAYNAWAVNIVTGWLDGISDEQWHQVISSSFSSIRQTAVHMVSAEKIWLDFWKNAPHPVYLSAGFTGTKSDLTAIWKATAACIKDFIEAYPEAAYRQQVTFIKPDGEKGRMPFWQTFAHFINHATFHRGQLVTLLRQAGFTGFSSTDLFTYYRTL